MRTLFAALILTALTGPAFAAAPAACTAVPFQYVKGRILLPLEVEGHSLRVLMDTGGDLSLTLSDAVLKKLRGVKATGKTARMGDLTGAIQEHPVHTLSALTFAGRSFANVEVIPDHQWGLGTRKSLSSPEDGVMGMGILGKQPFTLDLAGKTLYVGDRRQCADKLGKQWLEQPLHVDGNGLNVAFALDGQAQRFVIDSGATISILHPTSVPKGEHLQACQQRMPNGAPCFRLLPRKALTGGQAIVPPALYVLDFKGLPVDGLLGIDYLQQLYVHIDVPGRVLALRQR